MNGDDAILLSGVAAGAGLVAWGVFLWRDRSLDGSGWALFGAVPTTKDERYAGRFRRINAAFAIGGGAVLIAVCAAVLIGRLSALD